MTNLKDGPFPPPASVTLPTTQVTTTVTGTVDVTVTAPFYYAGITNVWLYWQADLALLNEYLSPYAMVAADFGGFGLVSVNFFNAVIQYGYGSPGKPGGTGFTETELNIVGYPVASEGKVPQLTAEEFLAGADQTKRLGNYRVWVACDDVVAVAAGQQVYFENKFLTTYSFNVPALNNPTQSGYTFTCNDPGNVEVSIYSATFSLAGLAPVASNASEWIDYSFASAYNRLAASRRNYFGNPSTWMTQPGAPITLAYGASTHPMVTDMQRLIGSAPAYAVQTFQSPTCIAEALPYWADL